MSVQLVLVQICMEILHIGIVQPVVIMHQTYHLQVVLQVVRPLHLLLQVAHQVAQLPLQALLQALQAAQVDKAGQ